VIASGSRLIIVPPIMSTEPTPAESAQAEPSNAEPTKAEPAETAAAKPSTPPEAKPADAEGAADAKPAEAKPAAPDPQAEVARLRDQLLRSAADFDNYRKRARREQEDASRRGRESAVKELLPVFDNLERAAAHAESAPEAKVIADGVRMVMKQFNDVLEKMGIKRVATVGRPFDPSQHEAIQHLPSAEHPAGVIMAEVQSGYAIGDYLLRAAMVVVSKGAPEAEPAPN
jgi:molecular chaperone GrpE